MKEDENENAASYGDGCAEFYDDIYPPPHPRLISTLCELAGAGPVLELGIGTGRVALPLAARGIKIHGVEASQSMIAKLQEKPGATEIPMIHGDFADIRAIGSFRLIFALVNTFFLLTSRNEQRRCLKNVQRLLSDDGIFLIEAFKPLGAAVQFENGKDGSQDIIHVLEQTIETRRGPHSYRSRICYADSQTLDQMALDAGLRLNARWRDWQHPDLPSENDLMHISFYERLHNAL